MDNRPRRLMIVNNMHLITDFKIQRLADRQQKEINQAPWKLLNSYFYLCPSMRCHIPGMSPVSNNLSLTRVEPRTQDHGGGTFGVWWDSTTPHKLHWLMMTSFHRKASFIRTRMPLMEAPHHDVITLKKPYILLQSYWELDFNIWVGEKETQTLIPTDSRSKRGKKQNI